MRKQLSRVILFFFVFALVMVTKKLEGKIVQVQVLSRHCDRSPVSGYQIPNDPWDWKTFLAKYSYASGFQPSNNIEFDHGQLTGLGLQQCKQIGKHFNQRYLSRVLNISGGGLLPIFGFNSDF